MAREKQTRKELLEEPDAITVALHRIAGFFITYQKQVIAGIAAVLVVTAAVSGYFYIQHRSETEASILFAKAMDQYSDVIYDNGSPEDYLPVTQQFKNIVDNYGKTGVAHMALVQYAGAVYRSGNYEKAVAEYEKALSRMPQGHGFPEMVRSGLAYSYEALGDYENAIKHFELITAEPNAVTRDQALFKLGELYAATDNTEKSRAAYEKIVTAHTGSIYYELAKTKLNG
jgi:predicted negative regulator of RcsB-dependent stress response